MQNDNQEKVEVSEEGKEILPKRRDEVRAESPPVIRKFPGVSHPPAALYIKF